MDRVELLQDPRFVAMKRLSFSTKLTVRRGAHYTTYSGGDLDDCIAAWDQDLKQAETARLLESCLHCDREGDTCEGCPINERVPRVLTGMKGGSLWARDGFPEVTATPAPRWQLWWGRLGPVPARRVLVGFALAAFVLVMLAITAAWGGAL